MSSLNLLIKEIEMEQQIQKTIASDEKFCSDCGATIKAKAEICPTCGVRQMASPNPLTATEPNGMKPYERDSPQPRKVC